MPIVKSNYKSKPWYFINKHWETVIPSLLFNVGDINYERERLDLKDGDFLDLDWIKNHNDRLIILTHGLEGNTFRNYIKRPAKYFSERNWDILAWNCRSCSGEMNRLPKLYHHGSSDDLAEVVEYALSETNYKQVVLAGYSMGGSINIKYLSVENVPMAVKGSVNFSVPVDLHESTILVSKKGNEIYNKKFIQRLTQKAIFLANNHENFLDPEKLSKIENFEDFHKCFTIPVMGLQDINGFYEVASCSNFIGNLKYKSLIVNALSDPIIGQGCSPINIAEKNKYLYIENPTYGGHLGFSKLFTQESYMEERAEEFINEIIIK